jgi:hypothetical protein
MGFSLPCGLLSLHVARTAKNTGREVIQMILTGLAIGGLILTGLLVLVIGVRATERCHGLRNPYGDGLARALARWVLGVYVRQIEDCDQDNEDCYGQVGR